MLAARDVGGFHLERYDAGTSGHLDDVRGALFLGAALLYLVNAEPNARRRDLCTSWARHADD